MKSGNYSIFHARYLVIKTLAYFPLQSALNAREPLNAVLSAARTAGIKTQELSFDSDAAVIWSVLWSGRMTANRAVYQHYRAQNKLVIVVEIGALDRGRTWKVSVNHTTAEGYYGHLENLDWDRPRQLGFSLSTTPERDPRVVIALQHSQSLQTDGLDMLSWVNDAVARIRQYTDRPIVVRPHPRSKIALPTTLTVDRPYHVSGTYDSFNLPLDCHAIVNYNSGPGIQAAVAGVRPIVDYSSLAYPVSVGYAGLEQPYETDRDLWFTQMCHTEYTVDELRQGVWIKRLKLL